MIGLRVSQSCRRSVVLAPCYRLRLIQIMDSAYQALVILHYGDICRIMREASGDDSWRWVRFEAAQSIRLAHVTALKRIDT